jgi:hypothetical protein
VGVEILVGEWRAIEEEVGVDRTGMEALFFLILAAAARAFFRSSEEEEVVVVGSVMFVMFVLGLRQDLVGDARVDALALTGSSFSGFDIGFGTSGACCFLGNLDVDTAD